MLEEEDETVRLGNEAIFVTRESKVKGIEPENGSIRSLRLETYSFEHRGSDN